MPFKCPPLPFAVTEFSIRNGTCSGLAVARFRTFHKKQYQTWKRSRQEEEQLHAWPLRCNSAFTVSGSKHRGDWFRRRHPGQRQRYLSCKPTRAARGNRRAHRIIERGQWPSTFRTNKPHGSQVLDQPAPQRFFQTGKNWIPRNGATARKFACTIKRFLIDVGDLRASFLRTREVTSVVDSLVSVLRLAAAHPELNEMFQSLFTSPVAACQRRLSISTR